MKSIGFGLERVGLLGVVQPWLAAVLLGLLVGVAGYGFTKVTFDENLRNVFGGSTKEFANYLSATREFVDPESELIVLVEGDSLGKPETFSSLRDLQFELQFIDGIVDVFSFFALREAPTGNSDDAPLVVDDTIDELTGARVARIRSHPLLGSRLLSADASAMVYVVTPENKGAPLAALRVIKAEIELVAGEILAGSDVTATVTGFPAIRIGIVDILVRDQRVLNSIAALIGFVMSLIIFSSLTAAIMTAVPSIFSAMIVAGGLGALGMPITVMTNVVPVLVMILGYANSMHLCRAWRLRRDAGGSPVEAARYSIQTIGPACILASLTTSVAFLSLVFSDVRIVSDFGWVGAFGVFFGALVVLALHGFLTVTIGRYWKAGETNASTVLVWLGGPSAAIGRFTVNHARPINALVFLLVPIFGAMYAVLQPAYSIGENLSKSYPASAALVRIDEQLGGSYPIHIIVPHDNLAPTSPEALEAIGAVHRAVAKIEGVGTPLSLWTLVEWFGDATDSASGERLEQMIAHLAPTAHQRFYGAKGGSLISTSIREASTAVTQKLIDSIETTARAAGGEEVIVTGVTVVTAREATRTIGNLNFSLIGAVISGLLVILVAFRSWRIAVTSVVPNVLPLLGTGALLFFLGGGIQFTGVLALTVAFGIAVDGTIHYLNYFYQFGNDSKSLHERLVETTRRIGPQLIGTTAVIVAGMATTQTSEMPTVVLFGLLAATTLLIGLVGDLVVLPALMAGGAKRWFTQFSNGRLTAPTAE